MPADAHVDCMRTRLPSASVTDILGRQRTRTRVRPTPRRRRGRRMRQRIAAAEQPRRRTPGPAPRASQVEPLRDLAAAQAAQASPPKQRVASVAAAAAGQRAAAAAHPDDRRDRRRRRSRRRTGRALDRASARRATAIIWSIEAMMPRVEHLLQRLAREYRRNSQPARAHRGDIDAVVVVHARAGRLHSRSRSTDRATR